MTLNSFFLSLPPINSGLRCLHWIVECSSNLKITKYSSMKSGMARKFCKVSLSSWITRYYWVQQIGVIFKRALISVFKCIIFNSSLLLIRKSTGNIEEKMQPNILPTLSCIWQMLNSPWRVYISNNEDGRTGSSSLSNLFIGRAWGGYK